MSMLTHGAGLSGPGGVSGPDVALVGTQVFDIDSGFDTAQTISFNHTSLVNGGILVRVFTDVFITSVSYGGQALTLIGTADQTNSVAIYVGSDTANSLPTGSNDVIVTYAPAVTAGGVWIDNVEGLKQTTASNDNDTQTGSSAADSGTQTVTINEGGLCVDIIVIDATSSLTPQSAGQTEEDEQQGEFGLNNAAISFNTSQSAGSIDSEYDWSGSLDFAHVVGALDKE